jgi:UDP-sulfoquinovose synthase
VAKLRILILGADGYLGWPTAMHFASRGHDVWAVDNYLRRSMALETNSEALIPTPNLSSRARIFEELTGKKIKVLIGDLGDYEVMVTAFEQSQPDVVIHYAEQPSAPYSMMGRKQAQLTLRNNLNVTLNCIWAAIEKAPKCHIVKLGTMGEYGTPNIDIEEGWLDITHNGRKDRFLFPRAAGSLYHTTKVLDTDLLWFYVRTYGIRVTDLMQGPVYGLLTAESRTDTRLLPNFHYDDIFGTVINRFLVQAIAGVPLTVYGKGGQTRGYLDLRDTLQCIALAADSPPTDGSLRIFNQFTETFTVTELAERVARVGKGLGYNVEVRSVPNPRLEKEEHYYNPAHTGLLELGLEPNYLTDDVVKELLETIAPYAASIDRSRLLPRVSWNKS